MGNNVKNTEEKSRESGYYWVKLHEEGGWIIGEFVYGDWFLGGDKYEKELIVDERRIKRQND